MTSTCSMCMPTPDFSLDCSPSGATYHREWHHHPTAHKACQLLMNNPFFRLLCSINHFPPSVVHTGVKFSHHIILCYKPLSGFPMALMLQTQIYKMVLHPTLPDPSSFSWPPFVSFPSSHYMLLSSALEPLKSLFLITRRPLLFPLPSYPTPTLHKSVITASL